MDAEEAAVVTAAPPAGSGVAILFSGGTDSTAAAALMARRFESIHLLTYQRQGFHGAANSGYNAGKLAARFPDRRIVHRLCETTALARRLSIHRRWRHFARYGFFTLQSCGFCALANQVASIAYCIAHGLTDMADGITHDWPFFPGHMDLVIDRFRELAGHFGITYHTPVLQCDVDRQIAYVDKLVAAPGSRDPDPGARTTGRILRELGLSDVDNYKGTDLDRSAQARCFQFVLPNLFIYWVYRGPERWEEYEATVLEYFGHLIDDAKTLLEEHRDRGEHADLFAFLHERGAVP